MTKLTGAALDRALANALGVKSVHDCENWGEHMIDDDDDDTQVYKKPWVGLTIYEMDEAFDEAMKVRPKYAKDAETRRLFAQAIEDKLKEKNA